MRTTSVRLGSVPRRSCSQITIQASEACLRIHLVREVLVMALVPFEGGVECSLSLYVFSITLLVNHSRHGGLLRRLAGYGASCMSCRRTCAPCVAPSCVAPRVEEVSLPCSTHSLSVRSGYLPTRMASPGEMLSSLHKKEKKMRLSPSTHYA